MEVISKYEKNKDNYNRWRVRNQDKINSYYRDYHRKKREEKLKEERKQIALEYLQEQLLNK